MRQLSLKFLVIRILLKEIYGATAIGHPTNKQMRLSPGLLHFVSNLRTRIHIERFADNLKKEESFLKKKTTELCIKHFGENQNNWVKFISVPENSNNPDKLIQVLNPKWDAYEKEEQELLNTEVEVSCFDFTEDMFDIDTSFCHSEIIGINNSYYRISKTPSSFESLEQFTAPFFIKHVVSMLPAEKKVYNHKYPIGDE